MFYFFRLTLAYIHLNFFIFFSTHKWDFSDPNVLFPNKSENLISYRLRGLYRITCIKTNKVYIGESSNVLSRSRYHIDGLASNTNDCYEMQADFNQHGIDSFTFHVLFWGPEWADLKKRQEKEKEILSSYAIDQVYNVHPDTPKCFEKNYRIRCRINGQKFKSTKLQLSETVIRNRLNNNYPDYEILEKIVHGYTPIIIEGKE